MAPELKMVKSFSRIETQKLGFGLLAGFLVSLTYLAMSSSYSIPFPTINSRLSSMRDALASLRIQDRTNSLQLDAGMENRTHESKPRCDDDSSFSAPDICQKVRVEFGMNKNSTSNSSVPFSRRDDGNITAQHLGIKRGLPDHSSISALKNSSVVVLTADTTPEQNTTNTRQTDDGRIEVPVTPKQTKPLCDFSNRRSNICEMDGDIRILGNSSSIIYATSPPRNESWHVKPYPRKTDLTAMSNVRELLVRSSAGGEPPPRCDAHHSVPAVVFSVAGYTGNYFHDFTDVLVPLFLTSRQFNGEVRFLVTDFRSWWINKYRPYFTRLSNHPIIDLNNEARVHCFRRAIVGLRAHDDLTIDPSRSPSGVSMPDFTEFMRRTYSLPRDSPVRVGGRPFARKPRLLIVARSRTRRFANLGKIVRMAERLGFDVVVGEAEADIAHFAGVVNSCDVMMGVHGAGLTNLVFLPTNAVFIQVVPFGKLDWIAKTYFGWPASSMRLRYLEYSIGVEESTLTELYPRDHPVFKDPMSIHKLGWTGMREIYLVKQNVKLNVKRFRPVLVKALRLLLEK